MSKLGATWSACAFLLCDAAKQLRSHCPDTGNKANVSCFFYQDVDFVQQQGLRVANFTATSAQKLASLAHEVDWPWLVAGCASILVPGLLYWVCKMLLEAGFEALHQMEEDWEITAETKSRIWILLDAVLLMVDVALDIKVGIFYCSQGLWLFGPLALAIPGLAGLACFAYKRWNWTQTNVDTNFQYWMQNLDEKGRTKPGLLVLLRQVFQCEALATAYQTYQNPQLYENDWLVERSFNGVVEAFPQCLLQTYTLLCLEQAGLQTDPVDAATQVASIVLSCYSIAKALGHMSFKLLPERAISPLPEGLTNGQLQLLQFADVSSRLLSWAALGAALRTPGAAVNQNNQFVLPTLMILELLAVAWLLRASLQWKSSLSPDAILSVAIAYLSTPMVVFNGDSHKAMHTLQGVLCCWRAVELFCCVCFVWYRGHAINEPHVLLFVLMTYSVVAYLAVLATVLYDRIMRAQRGRPVLPTVWEAEFTVAHWACTFNNLQLLKRCGSETLRNRNIHGWVPAHSAAFNGHEAALEILHDLAPDILSAKDVVGAVPAHYAAWNGHEAALELLHDLAPDTLSAKDSDGAVPAHYAAWNGHEAALELLHDLAPDTLSAKDNDGAVPAHYAGQEAVQILHDLVPETLFAKDSRGLLPAHHAASNGHEAALEILHELVPETLFAKDSSGRLPAHHAAGSGQEAALEILHDQVPETLFAKDNRGRLPTHIAAETGQEAMLKLMRNLVPETFFVLDDDGWLPIHLARMKPECGGAGVPARPASAMILKARIANARSLEFCSSERAGARLNVGRAPDVVS